MDNLIRLKTYQRIFDFYKNKSSVYNLIKNNNIYYVKKGSTNYYSVEELKKLCDELTERKKIRIEYSKRKPTNRIKLANNIKKDYYNSHEISLICKTSRTIINTKLKKLNIKYILGGEGGRHETRYYKKILIDSMMHLIMPKYRLAKNKISFTK